MPPPPDAPPASVRIDKWLWAARCFKTRSQATAACDGGHVHVNDQTARPSRPVRVGDTVEALTPGGKRVLLVRALAERRGPAAVAASLFEDRTPPEPVSDLPLHVRRALEPTRERGAGRPTKRDRRALGRLKEW